MTHMILLCFQLFGDYVKDVGCRGQDVVGYSWYPTNSGSIQIVCRLKSWLSGDYVYDGSMMNVIQLKMNPEYQSESSSTRPKLNSANVSSKFKHLVTWRSAQSYFRFLAPRVMAEFLKLMLRQHAHSLLQTNTGWIHLARPARTNKGQTITSKTASWVVTLATQVAYVCECSLDTNWAWFLCWFFLFFGKENPAHAWDWKRWRKKIPGSSPQVPIILRRPNTKMLEVNLVKKA